MVHSMCVFAVYHHLQLWNRQRLEHLASDLVPAVTNWCKFSKNRMGGEILNKNLKDVLAIVNTKIRLHPASAFIVS